MSARVGGGPDIVIAAAARSGTSFLASTLGAHPQVDACAVKEPNYFSREFERGAAWYDALFPARREGRLRLDASMSYTFPHFPDALDRLAEASPDAVVLYLVRHPVARMLSHFQLHRDYFRNEPATTLGAAVDRGSVYAGTSDYAEWLRRLDKLFGPDRLLVVPFGAVTGHLDEVLDVVADRAGLEREPLDAAAETARAHRNDVVALRGRGVLVGRRLVRRSGLYPAIRRGLGPDRLRQVRSWVTRPVETESLAGALATCRVEQRVMLAERYASAAGAVADHLAGQDVRLGLDWSAVWGRECPLPGRCGSDW
jgi:hypothetical protein